MVEFLRSQLRNASTLCRLWLNCLATRRCCVVDVRWIYQWLDGRQRGARFSLFRPSRWRPINLRSNSRGGTRKEKRKNQEKSCQMALHRTMVCGSMLLLLVAAATPAVWARSKWPLQSVDTPKLSQLDPSGGWKQPIDGQVSAENQDHPLRHRRGSVEHGRRWKRVDNGQPSAASNHRDQHDPVAQSAHHGHGIHVAGWRWDEIGIYLPFTLVLVVRFWSGIIVGLRFLEQPDGEGWLSNMVDLKDGNIRLNQSLSQLVWLLSLLDGPKGS